MTTTQAPACAAWTPARWQGRIFRGSSLYLLSAACILYGLSKLLIPLFDPYDVPAQDGFLCIVAINAYELSLLAVALLIVWRNVRDDAVWLTMLIGLFLVASAATLNVVAALAPLETTIIGGCAMLLAGVKLYLVNRRILRPFTSMQTAALTVIVIWNFVMPNLLASTMVVNADREHLLMLWRAGLLVVLSASVPLLIDLARRRPGELGMRRDVGHYLHSRRLATLATVLILAASWLHAYGQTFAFNLPVHALDLMPMTSIAAVWFVLHRRARGKRRARVDVVIAALPLALCGYVMIAPPQTDAAEAVLRVMHHPGVCAALTAIGAAALAAIGQRRDMFIPMVMGLAMSVATCDVATGSALDSEVVHIDATLLVMAAVFGIGAVLFRQPSLGLISYALLVVEVYRLLPDAGWRWVGMSFMLLIAGAAISLIRGDHHAAPTPRAAMPEAPA